MSNAPEPPEGLGIRGARLWVELNSAKQFDPAERVIAEEACRIADRLERLDGFLVGTSEDWFRFEQDRRDDKTIRVVVDDALAEARSQANTMKQLLTALRLPDQQSGRVPQYRGARGAYGPREGSEAAPVPSGGGTVSSLDRARQRAGA